MRADQVCIIQKNGPYWPEYSQSGDREGILFRNEEISLEMHVVESSSALHYHECYELEIALSGEAENCLCDRRFEFCRGALAFLSRAAVHSVSCRTTLKVLSVKFTDTVPGLAVGVQRLSFPVMRQLNEAQTMRVEMHLALLQEELKLTDDPIVRAGLAENFIAWVLAFALKQGGEQQTVSVHEDEQILRVIEYVRSGFRHPLSLQEVARRCGYSPNYLGVRFRRGMGMSFSEYVCGVRLDYARGLLRHSGLSIQRVSELSGFESPSYFARRFRRQYGMTPAEFRRER